MWKMLGSCRYYTLFYSVHTCTSSFKHQSLSIAAALHSERGGISGRGQQFTYSQLHNTSHQSHTSPFACVWICVIIIIMWPYSCTLCVYLKSIAQFCKEVNEQSSACPSVVAYILVSFAGYTYTREDEGNRTFFFHTTLQNSGIDFVENFHIKISVK